MSNSRVTVMGSFVVDLMGRAPHLPVPGETVKGIMFKMGPGGKGSNQGVAAKRSGADVNMITKLGKDGFAEIALKSFTNEGIDIKFIFQDEQYTTGTALILVDDITSENEILVTLAACDHITDEDIDKVKSTIINSKVFLTQLETNVDAVEKTINIASSNGVLVILNPAPIQQIPDELLKKVNILTPNEVEASILSGIEIITIEDAKQSAEILMQRGAKNVIITLGSKGSLVVTKNKTKFIESLKVNVVDTTGAGDAFNGGLATALAEGKDIFEAAEFANAVGALSVTKIGTAPSMPYRNEIDKFILMF